MLGRESEKTKHRHTTTEGQTNSQATPGSIAELETEARKKQAESRILKGLLASTGQNTNFELWAGREFDDRRRKNDIYDRGADSTIHVIQYEEAMEKVRKSGQSMALLHELVQSWTTTINFIDVATLLTFTQQEVENLIQKLENGHSFNDSEPAQDQMLNKNVDWYPEILKALELNDTIVLIMMRTLILESFEDISLAELFRGLRNYILRETSQISSESKTDEESTHRLAELRAEKQDLFATLRTMNRPRKRILPKLEKKEDNTD